MNKDNVKEFCKTISVYTVKSLRVIKENLFKNCEGMQLPAYFAMIAWAKCEISQLLNDFVVELKKRIKEN